MTLNEKRLTLLRFIESYWNEHGYGPLRRELATAIGGVELAQRHLIALEHARLIEWRHFRNRPVNLTLEARRLLNPDLPWDDFPADAITVTKRAYEWLRPRE